VAARTWVLGFKRMGMSAIYLTFANLGFFDLADLLAPREAEASIAPADSLLWPDASIFF
jgi:hypothetical protein